MSSTTKISQFRSNFCTDTRVFNSMSGLISFSFLWCFSSSSELSSSFFSLFCSLGVSWYSMGLLGLFSSKKSTCSQIFSKLFSMCFSVSQTDLCWRRSLILVFKPYWKWLGMDSLTIWMCFNQLLLDTLKIRWCYSMGKFRFIYLLGAIGQSFRLNSVPSLLVGSQEYWYLRIICAMLLSSGVVRVFRYSRQGFSLNTSVCTLRIFSLPSGLLARSTKFTTICFTKFMIGTTFSSSLFSSFFSSFIPSRRITASLFDLSMPLSQLLCNFDSFSTSFYLCYVASFFYLGYVSLTLYFNLSLSPSLSLSFPFCSSSVSGLFS